MDISIIFRYVGIPYKHRGRDLTGLDCWGLPILIYRDIFGIELLDLDNYEQDWAKEGKNLFLENYTKQFEQIKKPEKLSIILFYSADKKIVNHSGIYLENGKFIHCIKAGVVISRLMDKIWKNRIQGFYRLKR